MTEDTTNKTQGGTLLSPGSLRDCKIWQPRGSTSEMSSSGKHHVTYFWLESFMLAQGKFLVSVDKWRCMLRDQSSGINIAGRPAGGPSARRLSFHFLSYWWNPTPVVLIHDSKRQCRTKTTSAKWARSSFICNLWRLYVWKASEHYQLPVSWTRLSSGILRRVVWKKLTDFLEMLTAAIVMVMMQAETILKRR